MSGVESNDAELERALRAAHQFLADAADGTRLGVVEDLILDERSERVSTIIVRGGWFGRRRLSIDARDVIAVLPGERRMIVARRRARPSVTSLSVGRSA